LQHGDEVLAADVAHGRPVRRVDVDPIDGDTLVPEGKRDALDVGGERDAEDAHGARHHGDAGGGWLADRPVNLDR